MGIPLIPQNQIALNIIGDSPGIGQEGIDWNHLLDHPLSEIRELAALALRTLEELGQRVQVANPEDLQPIVVTENDDAVTEIRRDNVPDQSASDPHRPETDDQMDTDGEGSSGYTASQDVQEIREACDKSSVEYVQTMAQRERASTPRPRQHLIHPALDVGGAHEHDRPDTSANGQVRAELKSGSWAL